MPSTPSKRAKKKILAPVKDFIPDAKPIVKWAGGKAALVPLLVQLLPNLSGIATYHEPFAGGLALYLAIHETLRAHDIEATVADANARLLVMYRAIATTPHEVVAEVARLEKLSYDELVLVLNGSSGHALTSHRERTAAAALLVNRRCFNGLWRENKAGNFNVPKGTSTKRSVSPEEIETMSRALHGVTFNFLRSFDCAFVPSEDRSQEFHYFDPPYHGTFTNYNTGGFGHVEQLGLAVTCRKLDRAGAKWMLSTSDTPLIREIYSGYDITEIEAPRSIAAHGSNRGNVRELVIRNYSGIREWTDNSKVTP